MAPALFTGLLDDATLLVGDRTPIEAVAGHLAHRRAAYASLVGPMVVPDTRLVEVGRHCGPEPVVEVQVVNSGGAGGLLGLSRRGQPGLGVVSVVSMLRDLDDLAGNAARVVAAADALDPEITTFVGLPYALGWQRAVEVVEAAGHCALVSPRSPADSGAISELVEQLVVLIDADLPFKIGGESPAYPVIGLLAAIHGLIEGLDPADAARLVTADQPPATIGDEAEAQRVRRRLRSVNCAQLSAVATTLSGPG